MQQNMGIELQEVIYDKGREHSSEELSCFCTLYLCWAMTKSFMGPKKGRCVAVHASVLHFNKEMNAKWMTITQQSVQAKATETAKSVGITYFKGGEGWCDRFLCHGGLSLKQHL
jgi:hypothetical protein